MVGLQEVYAVQNTERKTRNGATSSQISQSRRRILRLVKSICHFSGCPFTSLIFKMHWGCFSRLLLMWYSMWDCNPSSIIEADYRWDPHADKAALSKHYWNFLLYMKDKFPSVEHVILKTTPSTIQVSTPLLHVLIIDIGNSLRI